MVKVGDLVKIDLPDRSLDQYIAVVDEVRSWGVIAYVPMKSGLAWIRLSEKDYTTDPNFNLKMNDGKLGEMF